MQFLLRALQLAAFLAVVHFNSKHHWTPNGYIVAALGVAAAFLIAAPFLAVAKVRWWLLSRRNKLTVPVEESPFGVLEEGVFRPSNSPVPGPRLIGGKPRRRNRRSVPGFDGSAY